MNYQLTVQRLLQRAGVEINGSEPCDIRVTNDGFYRRVIRQGALGLGESYMDGWWDVPKLDEFFTKVLRAGLDKEVGFSPFAIPRFIRNVIRNVILNPQRISQAFVIGKRHYDIGNDLYRAMLDKRMAYSCGYWKNARILDEAQDAKLDLICRKLGIREGMSVLDVGCGWGSFAKYAAEKYDSVSVLGVTVSEEQAKLARELCQGLPVAIRLQDYRKLEGLFDRIVSVGMFEHVGYKNYRAFMEVVERHLTNKGLFLLHTIGGNTSVRWNNDWTEKHIFRNSMSPSVAQVGRAIEGLFVMEDWHNFSADYDRTLMAWFQNFEAQWDTLKSRYGERFHRMWKYYLLSFAGSFRARTLQLWQVVLSKQGVPGGYRSVR
jgi:cyclopropane-fatty-acyl-phospholipid synthase